MAVSSIRCALPFCSRADEEQTRCSLILRVVACVIGTIALLIGALVLCNIPALHTLGTIGGWVCIGAGGLSFILGLCLKCIRNITTSNEKRTTHVSSSNPAHQTSTDVMPVPSAPHPSPSAAIPSRQPSQIRMEDRVVNPERYFLHGEDLPDFSKELNLLLSQLPKAFVYVEILNTRFDHIGFPARIQECLENNPDLLCVVLKNMNYGRDEEGLYTEIEEVLQGIISRERIILGFFEYINRDNGVKRVEKREVLNQKGVLEQIRAKSGRL